MILWSDGNQNSLRAGGITLLVILGVVLTSLAFPAAQVLPRGMRSPTPPKVEAEKSQINIYAPPTVALPTGQRFMYLIPASEAGKIGSSFRSVNTYVTYQTQSHDERLIRFLQPGNTSGSWVEVLNIRER